MGKRSVYDCKPKFCYLIETKFRLYTEEMNHQAAGPNGAVTPVTAPAGCSSHLMSIFTG